MQVVQRFEVVTGHCLHCNEAFTFKQYPGANAKKWCGRRCLELAKQKRVRDDRVCVRCGSAFSGTEQAKVCPACKPRRREKVSATSACLSCGAEFARKQDSPAPKVYCSRKCSYEKRHLPAPACSDCGGAAPFTQRGRKLRLCESCRDRRRAGGRKRAYFFEAVPCRECGDVFVTVLGSKFCGSECRNRFNTRDKRNRHRDYHHHLAPNKAWYSATLAEVSAKTSGCCGICKGRVDFYLKFPDPMSPSIDHITPLSKGGSNQLDNLQLAHLQCNTSKGARAEPPTA